ncbi:30S ribosomal protein S20 [Blochmannia endosymbiont of Colobopsis nipponica]|uniref:30S ribosomal protein S20 n=1 Tax=Blochmannia endosymbiont of Colobopsis nipponica TaxID=2681987 RepID=UPI0017854B1A|nr:30S ribosomal protein S20 [Blochmannia endosymbiont of Colobopsis nipponica]QOI11290.1 30S ribosomal protein S20 [Blochmannia endosymbiont of Colobopsis nipponica]
MPNTKSSKKNAIKSENRRQHNSSRRSMIRTLIKKVKHAILEGNKKEAQIRFTAAQSALDRYATRGLIHKNKSARHKSKLLIRIKNMP